MTIPPDITAALDALRFYAEKGEMGRFDQSRAALESVLARHLGTVGACLALPEVQRGEEVVEWKDGRSWAQFRIRDTDEAQMRWTDGPGRWVAWHSVPIIASVLALPARLVAITASDVNPVERGPLEAS